jgi:GT2 family glycosyltransferase
VEARSQPPNPWLSVIVPTFNGTSFLPQALESIVRQNDSQIEVIAVDDGSTDSTIAIIEGFKGRLSIRLISQNHTGNWVANTNRGLAEAAGQWLSFLHQDDVWLPGRLASLRAHLAREPNVDFWLHPSWFIDAKAKRLGRWQCPLPAWPAILPPRQVCERLLVQNFVSMPAPLFRRELARRVGNLREDLWYTADWDYWLKLAETGRVAYINRPLSGFRLHPQSQTVRRTQHAEPFRRQLEDVLLPRLAAWEPRFGRDPPVRAAACFSVELNVALAGAAHGQRASWQALLTQFLKLGPQGWWLFLRDSRILERVSARLRAGLGT